MDSIVLAEAVPSLQKTDASILAVNEMRALDVVPTSLTAVLARNVQLLDVVSGEVAVGSPDDSTRLAWIEISSRDGPHKSENAENLKNQHKF